MYTDPNRPFSVWPEHIWCQCWHGAACAWVDGLAAGRALPRSSLMPLTVAADGTLTPAVHWLQGAPRGRALSFASHDCALMCALFALGAIAPRQARCFACSQCTSAVPHPSAPSPATLDQDAPPPTRSAASCAAQHPEDSATSVAALYPAGTQRASPTPPRRPRRGHDAVEPRGQLWEVVACRVVGIVGRVGQHEPHGRSGAGVTGAAVLSA